MDDKVKEAIELLNNSKSKNRVSGAKRLRKIASKDAGSFLVTALEKEIQDKRTWSVQYHLILALGHSKYEKGLALLLELANQSFEATILYSGLGDAIFRLSILSNSIADSLKKIYTFDNYQMTFGAFRALALLQILPEDEIIQDIIKRGRDVKAIEFVRGYPKDESGLRHWVAAACAGWKKELTEEFLNECKDINDSRLGMAVENSLKGKYVKWNPY